MAEANANATPPAASGGLTLEQVNEAMGKLLDSRLGTVTVELENLGKNQKVLADTLATLPPGKEKNAEEPKYLTMEDFKKALGENKAAEQASAEKTAARQKVIDAKLKDVPAEFLASLPDTADEAQLTAAADKIVTRVNEVLKVNQPNLNAAGADGGKTPAAGAAPAPVANGSLTPGQAAYAAGIVMPK